MPHENGGTPGAAAATIREHFEHLKSWIAGAYYSSEIGMRELGGRGPWPSLPYPDATIRTDTDRETQGSAKAT
jgi:hypothetical protein